MGVYFNPNNESFTQAKNSFVYVDKTGLLEMLNRRLSTENKCIAVSYARRFGKSHAAGMIDAYASINTFITMNYAGLKDNIMTMLAGGKVRVNTNTFQNDFSTVASKDDALTALIHLGYLGYHADRGRYIC